MQSSAITFAPSLSLSTRPRSLAARGLTPLAVVPNGKLHFGGAISASARKLSPISCSLKQNGWVAGPNPRVPEPESDGVVVRAAAENAGAAESPKPKSSAMDTLMLGSLFGLWYLFNIWFNIYNKQVVVALGFLLCGVLLFFIFLVSD